MDGENDVVVGGDVQEEMPVVDAPVVEESTEEVAPAGEEEAA